jgi:hypothetical protein
MTVVFPGSSERDPPTGDAVAQRLEAVSEAELIEAARVVEDRLGCVAWGVAAAGGVVANLTLDPGPAALVLASAIAVCVAWKIGRRSLPRVRLGRLAAEEFARRWWLEPIEVYEARAAELIESGEVDGVILLVGRALPHGGHRAIRIVLAGGATTAEARATPFLPDLIAGADLARQIVLPEVSVSAADTARLSAMLESLTPERMVPPPSIALDGFPCEISVLMRGRPRLHAALNLTGSAEGFAKHPVRELCALVLEIERAPSSQPPPAAAEPTA